jgi:hypothetical protein
LENAELDVALEELESRLERLRALYEQYFMGIERIEPAIPRKDIDRRIYVLRREKIRNTAKRFKLQTIISRYNTFQQYWQRICREIEAGTYKRHVIKAERIAPGKMLTIAARKRLGRRAFEDIETDRAQPAASDSAPPGAASSTPPPASGPAAVGAPSPTPDAAAAALTAKAGPLAKLAPPPKPGVRPAKPAAQAPEPAARRPFESLDLDMDFMGDWDPTAVAAKAPRIPAKPFGEALSPPLGAAAKPTPSAGAAASKIATAPGAPAPPKPVAAASPPKPPLPNPDPVATKPAAPPSALGIPPATRLGAAPIATRIVAKPAAAPVAALSDERVRELHARLVEAKRQTNDAGAVSVEGLAKSLKATEAKLREQHKNRKIDFDVVIKDGKAVLKPIVR